MHVLITGAAGFVGSALARKLLAEAHESGASVTLLDITLDQPSQSGARAVEGSFADRTVLREAMSDGVDTVYHLASIPGGAAERDHELGKRVNLDGTLELIHLCAAQSRPARFVFASSVAVYGEKLPAQMDETASCKPATSYGAHKQIGEIALADAVRRGRLTGCSLRLPGVVARPQGNSGLVSAFMSDIFWALRAGQPITIPVSRTATAWWISRECCVDNLLRAGTTEAGNLRVPTYQMPVLRLSMEEVLVALAARFGAQWSDLVTFEPDARIEALFGSYPVLRTPEAEVAGFRNDGTVEELVNRVFG